LIGSGSISKESDSEGGWYLELSDAGEDEVKRNLENRISVLETKSGSTPLANEIKIYVFFIFVKEIT